MKAEIVFAEQKIKEAFEKLKDSKTEDRKLYEFLKRAFEDIEKEPACGIHVPNNLIPKEYIQKYNINNLWKYDLPDGWRLLYSIGIDKVMVIAIMIEWLDHKNYERRFGY